MACFTASHEFKFHTTTNIYNIVYKRQNSHDLRACYFQASDELQRNNNDANRSKYDECECWENMIRLEGNCQLLYRETTMETEIPNKEKRPYLENIHMYNSTQIKHQGRLRTTYHKNQ